MIIGCYEFLGYKIVLGQKNFPDIYSEKGDK